MAQWPYAGAVASHGAGGVIPHGMDVGYSGGSQGSHGGYMDYATLSSPQLSPLHAPDNLGLGFAPLPPSAEPDDLRVGLGGIGAGMTVDSSFSALPPGWRASAQPPASHGNRAMLSGDAGHVHHNGGSHGTSSLVMAGALAQHNDDQHKRFTLTISPSGKRRGQPPRARVRSTPVTPSVELPPCFLGGPRGGHCGEGCHTVLLDYPAHAPLDKVADGRCFALVPPRRQGDQATPSTPVRCAKKNLKPRQLFCKHHESPSKRPLGTQFFPWQRGPGQLRRLVNYHHSHKTRVMSDTGLSPSKHCSPRKRGRADSVDSVGKGSPKQARRRQKAMRVHVIATTKGDAKRVFVQEMVSGRLRWLPHRSDGTVVYRLASSPAKSSDEGSTSSPVVKSEPKAGGIASSADAGKFRRGRWKNLFGKADDTGSGAGGRRFGKHGGRKLHLSGDDSMGPPPARPRIGSMGVGVRTPLSMTLTIGPRSVTGGTVVTSSGGQIRDALGPSREVLGAVAGLDGDDGDDLHSLMNQPLDDSIESIDGEDEVPTPPKSPSPPPEPVIVRIRLPRSLMPFRMQERPVFVSCLHSRAATARAATQQANEAPPAGSRDVVADGSAPTEPASPKPAESTGACASDVATPSHATVSSANGAGGAEAAASTGGSASSITAPDVAAAPLAVVASPRSTELADIEAVHRSAVFADLLQAPMRGDSWLTGALIDFIVLQFAKEYRDVQFLPSSFAVHDAPRAMLTSGRLATLRPQDLVGEAVLRRDPASGHPVPLVFFWNIDNLHWNVIRVLFEPFPVLELFEPMGKPIKRNGGKGISARALPRAVIAWLDAVAPQPASGGWQACAVSAITEQQQFTGFDCGVACLLYAEKAAQRQAWQDIRAFTNQAEITEFRTTLYDYFRAVGLTTNSAPLVLAKKGRPRSAGRLRAFASAGRASKDTKAAAGRRRKGRGGSKVTARPAVQPAAPGDGAGGDGAGGAGGVVDAGAGATPSPESVEGVAACLSPATCPPVLVGDSPPSARDAGLDAVVDTTGHVEGAPLMSADALQLHDDGDEPLVISDVDDDELLNE